MTKLNPCPICGNEPDLTLYSGHINGVVCRCGLAVEIGATTGDAAINGWNDVTANFTQPTKTLRDEFALEVVKAMIVKGGYSFERLAENGYDTANEMLKERNK